MDDREIADWYASRALPGRALRRMANAAGRPPGWRTWGLVAVAAAVLVLVAWPSERAPPPPEGPAPTAPGPAPTATLTPVPAATPACREVLVIQGGGERLVWVDGDGELCGPSAEPVVAPAPAPSRPSCTWVKVIEGGKTKEIEVDERGEPCKSPLPCGETAFVRGRDQTWFDADGRPCQPPAPGPPAGCQEVVFVQGGKTIRQWVDARGEPCRRR